MKRSNVTLTDLDRCRLGRLLTARDTAAIGAPPSRFDLDVKLDEAQSVPAALAPHGLVTMNSQVRLIDLATGQATTRTLVYPDDRDLMPDSVSVLQELGRRILGRRVGDIVQIREHGQIRQFKIEEIVYQPEEAGAFHL